MRLILAAFFAALASAAWAAEPVLHIEIDARTIQLTRGQLLAHPDIATVDVADDVAYGGKMQYRAVPMASLLKPLTLPADSVLEAVATDGFVAQLPLGELLARGPDRAEAWLAIEEETAPWPKLKGKDASAGPFYLVWLRPQASRIGSEQWPYLIARFRSVDAPAKRWPQLNVDPALAQDARARLGQAQFIKHCLSCHRLNGGGAAAIGPDLNLPANPTDYFQPGALRRYLRDPSSLRSWPEQKMPGFGAEALSDDELDALIAYLAHMAPRKPAR